MWIPWRSPILGDFGLVEDLDCKGTARGHQGGARGSKGHSQRLEEGLGDLILPKENSYKAV